MTKEKLQRLNELGEKMLSTKNPSTGLKVLPTSTSTATIVQTSLESTYSVDREKLPFTLLNDEQQAFLNEYFFNNIKATVFINVPDKAKNEDLGSLQI